MKRTLLGLGAIVLLASACGPERNQRGLKDNGRFFWVCINPDADIACVDGEPDFPEAVAVGASFTIYFREHGHNYERDVRIDAPGLEEIDDQVFVATESANLWIAVIDDWGKELDVLELPAREVDEWYLGWSGGFFASAVPLDVGATTELEVIPMGESYNLAGTLEYMWSSSDEGVVRIDSDPTANSITIYGVSAGTAEVGIEQQTVTVEVGGG